jgi:TusA-related sulfurtransferase
MKLVDCRGMKCPMPIVQIRLALNHLGKGDEVMIYADDPTFSQEFLRFCYLADLKCITRTIVNEASTSYETYHAKLLR